MHERPIILISTCKRYFEVCRTTVESLAPLASVFDIVVISDTAGVMPEYAQHISKESDEGWCKMVYDFVAGLDSERQVMVWMDDLVIERISDSEILEQSVIAHREASMDYLSIYSPPWEQIDRLIAGTERYLKLDYSKMKYPISCMVSIFRAGFLLEVVNPSESPWVFERTASAKLRELPERSLFALRYSPIAISNIVVKGHIVPWRSKSTITKLTLPEMPPSSAARYKIKIILFSAFRTNWSKLLRFLLS